MGSPSMGFPCGCGHVSSHNPRSESFVILQILKELEELGVEGVETMHIIKDRNTGMPSTICVLPWWLLMMFRL